MLIAEASSTRPGVRLFLALPLDQSDRDAPWLILLWIVLPQSRRSRAAAPIRAGSAPACAGPWPAAPRRHGPARSGRGPAMLAEIAPPARIVGTRAPSMPAFAARFFRRIRPGWNLSVAAGDPPARACALQAFSERAIGGLRRAHGHRRDFYPLCLARTHQKMPSNLSQSVFFIPPIFFFPPSVFLISPSAENSMF